MSEKELQGLDDIGFEITEEQLKKVAETYGIEIRKVEKNSNFKSGFSIDNKNLGINDLMNLFTEEIAKEKQRRLWGNE